MKKKNPEAVSDCKRSKFSFGLIGKWTLKNQVLSPTLEYQASHAKIDLLNLGINEAFLENQE